MHRDGPKQPKEGFDFEKWLAKHQKFAVENVSGWVEAVKKKYGKEGTKYAANGRQILLWSALRHELTFWLYS